MFVLYIINLILHTVAECLQVTSDGKPKYSSFFLFIKLLSAVPLFTALLDLAVFMSDAIPDK